MSSTFGVPTVPSYPSGQVQKWKGKRPQTVYGPQKVRICIFIMSDMCDLALHLHSKYCIHEVLDELFFYP